MQPDEVGTMTGFKLTKQVMKLAVAGRRGSTKEKGRTPMVMGSRPMAKERAENGTAPMGGSLTPIIRGGGQLRWVGLFACSVDCSSSLRRKMYHTPHSNYIQGEATSKGMQSDIYGHAL